MAHTPGTWTLMIDVHSEEQMKETPKMAPRYGWIWAGRDIKNGEIGVVVASEPIFDDTDEADLRLTAAAPELLAACKEALGNNEDPITSAILRAAIAKAEGQP